MTGEITGSEVDEGGIKPGWLGGRGWETPFRGEVEAGWETCPEAETRVGAAGVGGEKRGRAREGTADSSVGHPYAGGGGGGRDWAGKGGGRGACTGSGAANGVWGVTKAAAVWSGGSG